MLKDVIIGPQVVCPALPGASEHAQGPNAVRGVLFELFGSAI